MYSLREFPEVFVDALLQDEAGSLLFASLFGRDGALQQLLAAFSLPAGQGGINSLTLLQADGRQVRTSIGNPDRLTKLTGRLPPTLFGQLMQLWIHDETLTQLDRASGSAWLLWPDEEPDPNLVNAEVWSTVKLLSPVPLLDAWALPVLAAIGTAGIAGAGRLGNPPIGRVNALKITLPADFAQRISALVRNGTLTLENQATTTAAERLAA